MIKFPLHHEIYFGIIGVMIIYFRFSWAEINYTICLNTPGVVNWYSKWIICLSYLKIKFCQESLNNWTDFGLFCTNKFDILGMLLKHVGSDMFYVLLNFAWKLCLKFTYFSWLDSMSRTFLDRICHGWKAVILHLIILNTLDKRFLMINISEKLVVR